MPSRATRNLIDAIFVATETNRDHLNKFINNVQGGWEVWLQVQIAFILQSNTSIVFTREVDYGNFSRDAYSADWRIQHQDAATSTAVPQMPIANPQIPNSRLDLSTTTGVPQGVELKVQNNLTENPILKFRDDVNNLNTLAQALNSIGVKNYSLFAGLYVHSFKQIQKTALQAMILTQNRPLKFYRPNWNPAGKGFFEGVELAQQAGQSVQNFIIALQDNVTYLITWSVSP